jgi:hypothetical protein
MENLRKLESSSSKLSAKAPLSPRWTLNHRNNSWINVLRRDSMSALVTYPVEDAIASSPENGRDKLHINWQTELKLIESKLAERSQRNPNYPSKARSYQRKLNFPMPRNTQSIKRTISTIIDLSRSARYDVHLTSWIREGHSCVFNLVSHFR